MRSDLTVLQEPGIDCDLSLFGGVEPFRVEHFSTKCPVKAFIVSSLPWRAQINFQSCCQTNEPKHQYWGVGQGDLFLQSR